MFSMQQLVTMITMQESLQVAQLGADWRALSHNYGRAIAVEAAEAMDHVGYKWWKDQAIDMEQLRMEAIDMLHFEFCSAMTDYEDVKEFTDGIKEEFIQSWWTDFIPEFSKNSLLETLDEIAIQALQGEYTIRKLIHLFRLCNLTGDDVFKLYIGKNVLNKFRRDNGYKEGSYIKDWAGNEDNVQLTKIINSYTGREENFEELLYGSLDAEYDYILELNGRYKSY